MDHKIITINNAPKQKRKTYNSKSDTLSKISSATLVNKIFMNIEFEGKKRGAGCNKA